MLVPEPEPVYEEPMVTPVIEQAPLKRFHHRRQQPKKHAPQHVSVNVNVEY